MPWSYRRSKKIGGVRVNIGKSGITSVSTGNRVIGSSFSRRGVRQRVSLPGTGLSYRSKATGCVLPLALCLLVLASIACGNTGAATRSPTRSPSATPKATATSVPPTATIAPSATSVPTIEPSATRPAATAVPTAVPVRAATVSVNAFTCVGGCSVAPDPSCAIKGNVNSDNEKIYHTPGQRDYKRTNIKPEEGDRWFCTEAEAQAAGFRHAQR